MLSEVSEVFSIASDAFSFLSGTLFLPSRRYHPDVNLSSVKKFVIRQHLVCTTQQENIQCMFATQKYFDLFLDPTHFSIRGHSMKR